LAAAAAVKWKAVPRPRLSILVAIALALSIDVAKAASLERAFRVLSWYNTADHATSGTQNFDLTQDARGVMYFANLAGVLEYDGVWWRFIPLPHSSPAFAVEALPDGRVAVGAGDELGYLEPDPSGEMHYVSLLSQLPADLRAPGQTLRVYATPAGTIYVTAAFIARWDGRQMRVIERFPATDPPRSTSLLNGVLWLSSPTGLQRLVGDSIEPVPGGGVFAGKRCRPALVWNDGRLLVSVRNEGLFLFDGKSAVPFDREASERVARDGFADARRLGDGRISLATRQGGIVLLRPDGAIDEIIDPSVGLPDSDIAATRVASDGSLWIALDSGVVRLEVSSPFATINARGGLRGSIEAVTRFHGTLYVGTTSGLYTIEQTTNGKPEGDPHRAIAKKLDPKLSSSFALLQVGDQLIAGSSDGILAIEPDGRFTKVDATQEQTAYALAQSRVDPGVIWVGTEEGLGTLRREGGQWRWEGLIAGVPHVVRAIVEEPAGVVWLGTSMNGIARAELALAGGKAVQSSIRSYGRDEMWVFRAGNRLVFASGAEHHLLTLDERTGRFSRDPILGKLGNETIFDTLADDSSGRLWINTSPPAVIERGKDGIWKFDDHRLQGMSPKKIDWIYPESDGRRSDPLRLAHGAPPRPTESAADPPRHGERDPGSSGHRSTE
jgi:ligand-binding sensor domain-containing protein